VIANDINVYGVKVSTPPTKGTVTLNADGTFTYVPNAGWTAPDSFAYQANGSGPIATVTLDGAPVESAGGIAMNNITYTSNLATYLKIAPSGILSVDKDALGYPLIVNAASVTGGSGLTLSVDPNGGFNASVAAPGTYNFTYKAQNSQGTISSTAATVTLIFPSPSNLAVTVYDGSDKATKITDYVASWKKIVPSTSTPPAQPTPRQPGAPALRAASFQPLGRTSIPATCRLWRQVAQDRSPANRVRKSGSRRGVRHRQRRLPD
jgi:hypothetical protein